MTKIRISMDLAGKNAIVGGASKGIGKAISLELARRGASLTLLARSKDKLEELLSELDRSNQQDHDYLLVDYSNLESLSELITEAASKKRYHILINNTGGPPGGAVVNAQLNEFKNAFNNHVLANQMLTQIVVPGMKEEGYGRVINIISTSVKQPLDGLGVSNTIRGAVANWSKTMANELGSFGITVNNVLPGATATDRLSEIIQNKARKLDKSEEEVQQKMKSAIPVGRFARPEEIAYAVAFLSSSQASYINGINLPVDGGRTKSL